jgi:hypothetical protein
LVSVSPSPLGLVPGAVIRCLDFNCVTSLCHVNLPFLGACAPG